MKFNKYLLLFFVFGSMVSMQTKTMNSRKRKANDVSNHNFMEEDSNFLISEQQLKKYIYYKSHNILDDPDIGTIILGYIYSKTDSSKQEQKSKKLIDIEKIKKFILKGKKNNSGDILLSAFEQGCNEDIIQKLISLTTNVNAVNQRGYSALYYAICGYSTKIVYQLIQAGANVNLIVNGQSLLQIAVDYHYSINVLMELIKYGANPNISVSHENIPLLIWAINNKYIDLIRLIKDKIDINLILPNVYPNTALGYILSLIDIDRSLFLPNQHLDEYLKDPKFKVNYNIVKELILAGADYSNFLNNSIIQSILKDEVLPCYKNNLEILPPVLTDIIMQYAIDPNYKTFEKK